jgi:hypothetical protein
MVVGAANDALADLALDRVPALPATDHCFNLGAFGFRVEVVKIQHRGIRFAAVDTWMGREVLEDPQTCRVPVNWVLLASFCYELLLCSTPCCVRNAHGRTGDYIRGNTPDDDPYHGP